MLIRMPVTPRTLGVSLSVKYPSTTSPSRLTFHRAVTMEISASLSALESDMVEMIWHTAKLTQAGTNAGLMGGTPFHRTKSAAKGSRKVKRPHTLMYSSSEWPRRFITVLRSTWQSAATSARTNHMRRILREAFHGERHLDGVGRAMGQERALDL